MPDLVPANGQFGYDDLLVYSEKTKTAVRAKYLRDNSGENYIIDPITSKPYVVPENYDPNKTIKAWKNRREAISSFINDPWEFGNNRGNVPHIQDGADYFNQGIFGVSPDPGP